MARDFDGVGDQIDFGSDASIDGFTQKTVAFWVRGDTGASTIDVLLSKGVTDTDGWNVQINTFGAAWLLRQEFSTGLGEWYTGSFTAGQLAHIVFIYDNSSTTNDAVIWKNGTSMSISELTTPTGTASSDAGSNLIAGNTSALTQDLDGLIGFLCYDNTLWTGAEVNRHLWWGCAPGGPSTVKVWQPFWTSDLNNRGTATANGTATGTTMDNTNCTRIERMWGSMMGCGR